jgi:predicted ArsR family transcriptional regulator
MKLDKDGSGSALNLNEEIRRLKGGGMSLRQIAVALGLSHEAIRKRLKGLEGKDRVSANGKENPPTVSIACRSRASEKIKDTVNQVSTQKTPSLTLNGGVNPPETSSDKPTEGKKGAFARVLSEIDNLLEAIKEFLETKGIEVYRMQVGQEAYQVEDGGQIIRFYVQRKQTGES